MGPLCLLHSAHLAILDNNMHDCEDQCSSLGDGYPTAASIAGVCTCVHVSFHTCAGNIFAPVLVGKPSGDTK